MSSIGLCTKGLIYMLWSELVFEGIKCMFGFVTKSLNVTSEHGSRTLNTTSVRDRNLLKISVDQKRTSIKRSDCFFTRVMFFPDQDAIAGLFYKNYGDSHVVGSRDSVYNSVSHISRKTKNTGIVHSGNNPIISTALIRSEEYWTGSTNNFIHETCEGDSSGCPVKRRGALEEMELSLDRAVTSIDVCVLLLTCDRLTAPLLRAKMRGVRVRVLLDRSMATVEGSSLSQLRRGCIPVRLLPRDTCNNAHYGNNNNNFGYNRSDGTTAAASSGLMHHKFAVIDAMQKPEETSKSLAQGRKEDEGEGSTGGLHELGDSKGMSAGITKGSDKREHGPCQEGAAMVITGSCNWTWSAVNNNNENIILSNRPELVVPFSEQFEQLWQEAW